MTHRDISRQGSNSAAFRANRTFHGQRLPRRILYFYGFALFTMCRFAEARRIQERACPIASRHDDAAAKAYAAAGLIFVSTTTEPLPLGEFQRIVDLAYTEAKRANDVHVFATAVLSIAFNYFNQGLVREVAEWAQCLLAFGRER